MNVVVVESPAKAKTINKYLGKDYQVFASFGHVRDLPPKDGSVKPDEDFAMVYETDPESKKHLSVIAKAAKTAENLYLATDPDREGEAISWHVLEALKQSRALPKDIAVHRVTFDEITKRAITEAFAKPRQIDMDLVNAQQARRALDYLVGFTLSPVLWRKLPGSKSAGRVQSVALRLICERDAEIEQFKSEEYWNIQAVLLNGAQAQVNARLFQYKGEKLEKFSITNEAQAKAITDDIKTKHYSVGRLETKEVRRYPAPPFTTSTLQQEASRKLGFGAKRTMQVAQKLYEAGTITYMRTDGVNISQEAIHAARNFIGGAYGDNFVPEAPRYYKSKSKNAQEAHEAIRPSDVTQTPEKLSLDPEGARLYELIWKRLVASQMENALFDQTSVDIVASPLPPGEGQGEGKVGSEGPHPNLLPKGEGTILRASGSVVKFEGFLKLYFEDTDDAKADAEEDARLPALKQDEALAVKEFTPEQHFTEPPPRYSEASLVKKLEELGIGRPSTYASIISVLQDRGYVRLDKKRFIAESLGRLVNAFLVSFFTKYVEYDFTADLEAKLDDVSAGEREWKEVLREFWDSFIAKIEESRQLSVSQVLEALDLLLAAYAFGQPVAGHDPRICPECKTGRLGLKIGRFGPYIACSRYPECNYKMQIGERASGSGTGAEGETKFPKTLGVDPATGMEVTLRKGPYGVYVQLGKDKTPKRAGLLKSMTPESITLDIALSLLQLPREVGIHPDSGKPIVVNNGKFGPYLLHEGKFTSLPPEEDPLTIGINRAVDVLANAPKKNSRFEALRVLGEHPDDKVAVSIFKGRYGPYVKHGKVNATLPKDANLDTFTLEEALPLLAARADAPPKKSFKKNTRAKKIG